MDVKAFYRNIDEKHSAVLSSLDRYFDIVISNSQSEKKEEALLNLGKAAVLLSRQMASKDQPGWLRVLINEIAIYEQKSGDKSRWKAAFEKIKANENAIRGHKWLQSQSKAIPLIDFDRIVEKHRDKETVEKLFESLIKALEKLIQCEELDSRRVAEDLERLLETLRKSEKGSFNAQLLTWSVAKKYIKNLGKSWLKETKIAQLLIKAAEETVDELGLTLDEASKQIQAEISEVENHLNQRLLESNSKQISADYTASSNAGSGAIAMGGSSVKLDSKNQSDNLSGQLTQLSHNSKD